MSKPVTRLVAAANRLLALLLMSLAIVELALPLLRVLRLLFKIAVAISLTVDIVLALVSMNSILLAAAVIHASLLALLHLLVPLQAVVQARARPINANVDPIRTPKLLRWKAVRISLELPTYTMLVYAYA